MYQNSFVNIHLSFVKLSDNHVGYS